MVSSDFLQVIFSFWIAIGPPGEQGIQGIRGAPGEAGQQGERGEVFLNGHIT